MIAYELVVGPVVGFKCRALNHRDALTRALVGKDPARPPSATRIQVVVGFMGRSAPLPFPHPYVGLGTFRANPHQGIDARQT